MRTLRLALIIGVSGVLFVCGAGAAAVVGFLGASWNRAAISTAGPGDFTNPLAVPPLAPSRLDGA